MSARTTATQIVANIATVAAPVTANAIDVWEQIVLGFGSQGVGTVGMYITTLAPSNVLYFNGGAVSRTAYANLWTWVQAHTEVYDATGANKTQFGPGDGSTTFSLPDFRGLGLRVSGTHATLAMSNGTLYAGGALLSSMLDQMQGSQLGADHDVTGARNLFAIAGPRDYDATGGSPDPNHALIQISTTYQGSVNMLKGMADGTNGTPRTGAENRMATVSINIGINYA
jgi:hypothetical protein